MDYIGTVQGIPVCFDAKECKSSSFALSNVHEHQYNFMKDFEEQRGIAFLLIYFTKEDRIYYMRFQELKKFYERAGAGGPKSVKMEELNEEYIIPYAFDERVGKAVAAAVADAARRTGVARI